MEGFNPNPAYEAKQAAEKTAALRTKEDEMCLKVMEIAAGTLPATASDIEVQKRLQAVYDWWLVDNWTPPQAPPTP